jgi:hypothetical protein
MITNAVSIGALRSRRRPGDRRRETGDGVDSGRESNRDAACKKRGRRIRD